ncbi:hypothetical protein ACFY05_04175 [Microtetraspora fusca]|uniref:Uncharacterized protein n=1 Tax=Microtetraspora fusca TaxID=1997 RepID=A0ABW6UY95_MICFU
MRVLVPSATEYSSMEKRCGDYLPVRLSTRTGPTLQQVIAHT